MFNLSWITNFSPFFKFGNFRSDGVNFRISTAFTSGIILCSLSVLLASTIWGDNIVCTNSRNDRDAFLGRRSCYPPVTSLGFFVIGPASLTMSIDLENGYNAAALKMYNALVERGELRDWYEEYDDGTDYEDWLSEYEDSGGEEAASDSGYSEPEEEEEPQPNQQQG